MANNPKDASSILKVSSFFARGWAGMSPSDRLWIVVLWCAFGLLNVMAIWLLL